MRGESEKFVVIFLVMRDFSGSPDTPKACVDFRDPTEVSRIIPSGGIWRGRAAATVDLSVTTRAVNVGVSCITISL